MHAQRAARGRADAEASAWERDDRALLQPTLVEALTKANLLSHRDEWEDAVAAWKRVLAERPHQAVATGTKATARPASGSSVLSGSSHLAAPLGLALPVAELTVALAMIPTAFAW